MFADQRGYWKAQMKSIEITRGWRPSRLSCVGMGQRKDWEDVVPQGLAARFDGGCKMSRPQLPLGGNGDLTGLSFELAPVWVHRRVSRWITIGRIESRRAAPSVQRGRSCIMSGSRGRRVILACGTGGVSPRYVIRQRWAKVAMEKTPSIQAKLSPMHWRLPAPKGK